MKTLADKDYKSLVDNITVVSRTDLNGFFIDVNDKFCELSGYSKEELIGQKPRMLTHPSVPESFHKEIWDSLRRNQTWHGVFKNINKMGDTYYLRSTIYPIINKNNKKIGYIAIRYLSHETGKSLENSSLRENIISDETNFLEEENIALKNENLVLSKSLEEALTEIERLKKVIQDK